MATLSLIIVPSSFLIFFSSSSKKILKTILRVYRYDIDGASGGKALQKARIDSIDLFAVFSLGKR